MSNFQSNSILVIGVWNLGWFEKIIKEFWDLFMSVEKKQYCNFFALKSQYMYIFSFCYIPSEFVKEMYKIKMTLSSRRCWIVNEGTGMLIVRRFSTKSANYCIWHWQSIGSDVKSILYGLYVLIPKLSYSVKLFLLCFFCTLFLFGCYITKLSCDQI